MMTNDLILSAVRSAVHYVRVRYPQAEPHACAFDEMLVTVPEQASHLLYMAERIEEFVHEGSRDKAFRWLGFMQGALWSLGWATIDESRQANMPPA